MRSSVLVLVLCLGCATAEDDPGLVVRSDAAPDTATGADTATGGDTASGDDTGSAGDSAPSDTTALPGDTGPCKLVINELQTGDGSSGNADFVEIFNSCGTAKSIGNHKLVYRSSSGTTDTVLFTFAGGASIPANGYRVIGGTSFSGSKDGALASGLAVGGGSVALKDDSDAVLDAVGYGSGTGPYVEGSAAPAPGDSTPAKSIARVPEGLDTDNNASDFKVGNATPGAASPP